MPVEEIGEIIKSSELTALLYRLAITANSLYEEAGRFYVDNYDEAPVLDVSKTLSANNISLPYDLPQAVNIFELFEKKEGGSIGISDKALSALKYYLNFRNTRIHNDVRLGNVTGPSAGCPVVQKSVRMRQDDLTQKQWGLLTEGDNPIASYNPDHQLLRFHRLVFKEVALFLADCVTGSF